MTATCFYTDILHGLFNPENGAKTWVDFQQTTWNYIAEDGTLHCFKWFPNLSSPTIKNYIVTTKNTLIQFATTANDNSVSQLKLQT
jgi:hypothetical protein